MRRSLSIIPIALCWCVVVPCADVPAGPGPAVALREDIERLFVDLDSNEFSVRSLAFERLQDLSADNASRRLLAEAVEQAMVDADLSFEVRRQLERLRRDLPPAELSPSPKIDTGVLDQLLAQLADDSYARRLGAESRLRWLLSNPDSVGLIYERVKHYAANVHLTHEQTRSLVQIYEGARAAWLEDRARLEDPEAPAEQIRLVVDRLAGANGEDRFRLTNELAAVVELRDLLASDANIDPIREALEARLAAGGFSPEAAARLNEMLALTKPAMVAEFWNEGRHGNIQRLLVDVPSVTEGLGTSHFDRIDDETAHVVTGVTLSEGDYPVGVAIPHPAPDPRYRTAFFHLVNLPTPRRRMAYEYRVKGDEAARYAAIAARTLERYLARQLPMGERELTMITQFDPREVSRFAGRYLATVDDRTAVIQRAEYVGPRVPLPPPEDGRIATQSGGGQEGEPPGLAPVPLDGPSIHGLLCSYLASKGTKEAVPGLLTAIEDNRLLAPSETRPYRFDRFAALAIAERDPWPDVDHWLARVLTRREELVLGQVAGPELGATAASILLRRHGGRLDDFDLIATDDVFARPYGLECYRWKTSDAPRKVADWWTTIQQDKPESQESPVEFKKENDE